MKNYRIVIVEYEHPLVGMKKTFALQKRIGLFFWYTVAHCDSLSQCRTYYENTKNRRENLIKILVKL